MARCYLVFVLGVFNILRFKTMDFHIERCHLELSKFKKNGAFNTILVIIILDLPKLEKGYIFRQNELKGNLFYPFQPLYGNAATSVVGSLLMLVIISTKYLLNTYYVAGGMQSSLYISPILTKSYEVVIITNPISQMVRLWLQINEHSIDSSVEKKSVSTMNKCPNTKSSENCFSSIPQQNNNFQFFTS